MVEPVANPPIYNSLVSAVDNFALDALWVDGTVIYFPVLMNGPNANLPLAADTTYPFIFSIYFKTDTWRTLNRGAL